MVANTKIKEIFSVLQKQMQSSLELSKAISHSTTAGNETEANWKKFLSDYLPKRYTVDSCIIIDSKNSFSQQIDLVIFDRQYCPFVINTNSTKYVPAESVYAVFEIKPNLNKEHLEYAAKKIESVRKLERTSVDIHHAGGTANAKSPKTIIGGILTTINEYTNIDNDKIKITLESLNTLQKIDIGCSINSGTFDVIYDINNKIFRYESKNSENALLYFFTRLFHRLQKIATVTAIDISAYEKQI